MAMANFALQAGLLEGVVIPVHEAAAGLANHPVFADPATDPWGFE